MNFHLFLLKTIVQSVCEHPFFLSSFTLESYFEITCFNFPQSVSKHIGTSEYEIFLVLDVHVRIL